MIIDLHIAYTRIHLNLYIYHKFVSMYFLYVKY